MVAHQVPPSKSAAADVAKDFVSGMQNALHDRRRVDELVTQFEYSGVVRVPAEGQEYVGQGAVKRFLTTLLVDNAVREARLDANGGIVVELNDGTGRPRELHLQPVSRGTVVAGITLISELHVSEESVHEGAAVAPLFSSAPASLDGLGDGPKWETFDGRVRQRIWQVCCMHAHSPA